MKKEAIRLFNQELREFNRQIQYEIYMRLYVPGNFSSVIDVSCDITAHEVDWFPKLSLQVEDNYSEQILGEVTYNEKDLSYQYLSKKIEQIILKHIEQNIRPVMQEKGYDQFNPDNEDIDCLVNIVMHKLFMRRKHFTPSRKRENVSLMARVPEFR